MIWIDLDNTLVYSPDGLDRLAEMLVGSSRSEARGRPLETVLVGGEPRPACVRASAHVLLESLRRIAQVRMLTTATRVYAEAMNTHFALGFDAPSICARENWMYFPEGLRESYGPQHRDVDPVGVLIDDDDETIHSRMKLAYLGTRCLIRIASFRGGYHDPLDTDLESFAAKVSKHVVQIPIK